MEFRVTWLGRIDYREAWRRQKELVAARQDGAIPDTLLLLEHSAVLTLGRHADPRHVLASPRQLRALGMEVIAVERGGEVTYHGPGQLVAYPIVRLADRGLLLRPFVRSLEDAMASVCREYGVTAGRREGYPGCWVAPQSGRPRKIGALGLKVERGVSYHGIALNVTTRLSDFELINACGLADLDVTSIAREAGWAQADAEPSTESVRRAGEHFARAFGAAVSAFDQPVPEPVEPHPAARHLVGAA
jgi:lipoyl(octanoyl) transferase